MPVKRKIGGVWKNIFVLSAGTLAAQLIPVVASVILAHIYTEEQYGNWGVFLSLAGILGILSTGQYKMAIVRPQKDADAQEVVRLCLVVCAGLSAFLLFVFLISDVVFVPFVTDVPCKYLMPFFVFGQGLSEIYAHYANRVERYKAIALLGVVRNGFQAVSRIGLGLLHMGWGLVAGAFVGVVAANVYGEWRLPLRRVFGGKYDWGRMRRMARRYCYFPIYQMPSCLLNAMATNLPLLVLAAFFSKGEVGHFSMTVSLLFLPVQLVGNAMSKIFYKKASSAASPAEVSGLASQLFAASFSVGLLICAVLIPFGEEVFAFFLGERWRLSGTYAMILAPLMWGTLCVSPLSVAFDAWDKQKTEMKLNAGMFMAGIAAVWMGGALVGNMGQTILLYGVCSLLVWAIEGYVLFRIVGLRFSAGRMLLMVLSAAAVGSLWIYEVLTQVV